MALGQDLKKKAMALSQKAMERLFADEKRAQKIAGAMGAAQRGKQALDRSQEEVLRALNLATKSDFKSLGKRLSALKRRVREMDERLDVSSLLPTQSD